MKGAVLLLLDRFDESASDLTARIPESYVVSLAPIAGICSRGSVFVGMTHGEIRAIRVMKH